MRYREPAASCPAPMPGRGMFFLARCSLLALFFLAGCGGGGSADPTPAITVQAAPVGQSVADGDSAALAVVASSASALSYQWQRDGAAIAGATEARYLTPALSMADNGARYTVELRAGGGAAVVPAAAVIVVLPTLPTIALQPSSQSVDAGQQATYSVQANGSPPLSYQWQRDGSDIPGAVADSFTTSPAGAADDGARFRVVVRNAAGQAVSQEALMHVNGVGPTLVGLLRFGLLAEGQRLVMSSTATGTAPFSHQWYRDGQPIAGASGTSDSPALSLVTPALLERDEGVRFSLSVTTADGVARSHDAVISVAAAAQVAAGAAHSLARSATGAVVWAWGDNRYGQLGLGHTVSSRTPVVVPGLTGVRTIVAGADHSLALKHDGTVWSWGRNASGALGDGSRIDRTAPQQVGALAGVVAIAAGDGRSYAVLADGTLWSWGDNAGGALGLGHRDAVTVPTRAGDGVAGFGGIVQVAAGARHALALRADGIVFAFGEVAVPLADGVDARLSPVPIDGVASVAAIAAGDGFSLALDIGGRAWAWGLNGSGQLGQGDRVARAVPTAIATPAALRVAAGHGMALLRLRDGSVLAWGALGSAETLAPAPMPTLPTPMVALAAGRGHALALRGDGRVYAWGDNAMGQLGIDSTEIRRDLPVQLPATIHLD